MKKSILLLGLMMAVLLLGACGKGDNGEATKKQAKEKKVSQEVKDNVNENQTAIYLVKVDKSQLPNDEQTGADISLPIDMCSGKLVAVGVDGKLSPQEALEKLFNYQADLKNGMYNAFSESKNIKIDKLIIKNNFAIVTLAGDIKASEVCGGQLMHDQIVKTLSQFDNVAGADVFVGGREINEYLSSMENK